MIWGLGLGILLGLRPIKVQGYPNFEFRVKVSLDQDTSIIEYLDFVLRLVLGHPNIELRGIKTLELDQSYGYGSPILRYEVPQFQVQGWGTPTLGNMTNQFRGQTKNLPPYNWLVGTPTLG